MKRIQGLRAYVERKEYKKALGIPAAAVVVYSLLAQGEYNINYLFCHPVSGKKYLLRVNCGSQMHLEDQIGYEYNALKQLERSGRTPEVFYVDGTRKHLNHGILVMEFLEGRTLNYRTDLKYAAECLADIHGTPIEKVQELLRPENPLKAILEECGQMIKVYDQSVLAVSDKKKQIHRMLDKMWSRAEAIKQKKETYHCCINTELNSTNFLINGEGKNNYLIDWEKPLYGMIAQDLGHFLAPTTTFWKTDVILTAEESQLFLELYIKAVDGRFPVEGLAEEVNLFIMITCLRGITWCAMAWVQYQEPDRMIFNESTFRKLDAYLSKEFLDNIENRL